MEALPLPTLIGLAVLVCWSFAERGMQTAGLHQPKAPDRERFSLIVHQTLWMGLILYSLADAMLLHWTALGPRFAGLMWIGLGIAASGVAIRIVARLTLGRNFSGHVQTTEGHRLVTTGIYRHIRHPAYLGYLLLLVGFPLCFSSLGGLGIALILGVPALIHRMRIEEEALERWFGDDYRRHASRTGRLLPRLR